MTDVDPKILKEAMRFILRMEAKQRGGPRTSEGRSRSSKNSRKHGITASDIDEAINNATEIPERLLALQKELMRQVEPGDEVGEALIRKALIADWRYERTREAISWELAKDLNHITDLQKSEAGWVSESRSGGWAVQCEREANDLRRLNRFSVYEKRYRTERDKAIREIMDRQRFG